MPDEKAQKAYETLRALGEFKKDPQAAKAAQTLVKLGELRDVSGGTKYPSASQRTSKPALEPGSIDYDPDAGRPGAAGLPSVSTIAPKKKAPQSDFQRALGMSDPGAAMAGAASGGTRPLTTEDLRNASVAANIPQTLQTTAQVLSRLPLELNAMNAAALGPEGMAAGGQKPLKPAPVDVAKMRQRQRSISNAFKPWIQSGTDGVSAAARAGGESALPSIGGFTGFARGAQMGRMVPGGPLAQGAGSLILGLAGAFGGSGAMSALDRGIRRYAQGDELFDEYQQQLAREAKQFPVETAIGSNAFSLFLGKPTADDIAALPGIFAAARTAGRTGGGRAALNAVRASEAGQRFKAAAGSRLMEGGVEVLAGAGESAVTGRPMDPRKIAIDAAVGMVLPGENRFGRKATGLGEGALDSLLFSRLAQTGIGRSPAPKPVARTPITLPASAPMEQKRAAFNEVLRLSRELGDPHPEVAAAQWALESGWGASQSGTNNFFGIKAKKGQSATRKTQAFETTTGRPEAADFVNYATPEEGIQGRIQFLGANRYRGYGSAKTPAEAIQGLVKGGYAGDTIPDPESGMTYSQQLGSILRTMGIDATAPSTGAKNRAAAPRIPNGQQRVAFAGKAARDANKVNPALVDRLEAAAAQAGLRIAVTTAITGHSRMATSGNVSRHGSGMGVDIASLDGVTYASNPKLFTEKAERLAKALEGMGASRNAESGRDFAVLFGFDDPKRGGNHKNHLHVSYRGTDRLDWQNAAPMAAPPQPEQPIGPTLTEALLGQIPGAQAQAQSPEPPSTREAGISPSTLTEALLGQMPQEAQPDAITAGVDQLGRLIDEFAPEGDAQQQNAPTPAEILGATGSSAIPDAGAALNVAGEMAGRRLRALSGMTQQEIDDAVSAELTQTGGKTGAVSPDAGAAPAGTGAAMGAVPTTPAVPSAVPASATEVKTPSRDAAQAVVTPEAIKVANVRDVMREKFTSSEGLPDDKLAWIAENGEVASDTNRRLRYVYDLSDGRKVSAEGVVRVLNPRAWDSIKQNKIDVRSAKGKRALFDAMPSELQKQVIDTIDPSDVVSEYRKNEKLNQAKYYNPRGFLDEYLKRNGHILAGNPQHPALKPVLEDVWRAEKVQASSQPATAQESSAEKPQTTAPRVTPRGKIGEAFTPDNEAIPFRYEVVEAKSLRTSHNPDGMGNLQPNPDYDPTLQPRDRSRVASREQVDDIANKLEFKRVADAPTTGDGAPVIGDDLQVESGNGRSIAIRNAYAAGKPSAARYKADLVESAARFGLDPATVQGMEQPTLVRVRLGNLAPEARAALAERMGKSTVAEMSEGERATSDARRLLASPDVLNKLSSANLRTLANQEFRSAFAEMLDVADRAGQYTATGELSQAGERRIQRALLAAAYEDADLLDALYEMPADGLKSIANALQSAAPEIARMKRDIKAGSLPALDISEDVAAAVREFVQIVKGSDLPARQAVKAWLSNVSMDFGEAVGPDLSPIAEDLLHYIGENSNRGEKLGFFLTSYTDGVRALGDPKNTEMFGGRKPTRDDVLTAAKRRAEEKYATTQTADLFGQAEPKPAPVAEPTKTPRANRAKADNADAPGGRGETEGPAEKVGTGKQEIAPVGRTPEQYVQEVYSGTLNALKSGKQVVIPTRLRSWQINPGMEDSIRVNGPYFEIRNGKTWSALPPTGEELRYLAASVGVKPWTIGEDNPGTNPVSSTDVITPAHEMTFAELLSDRTASMPEMQNDSGYIQSLKEYHREQILSAQEYGLTVPPSVLAEYPELTNQEGAQENNYAPPSRLMPLIGSISRSVAQRAHSGTSFTPETRAGQEVSDYREQMQADWDYLQKYAKTDETLDLLRDEFQRYASDYAAKKTEVLQSRSGIVSSMIAGPANFPTARMEKRNDAYDRKREALSEWRTRALAAIKKKVAPETRPVMAGDANAVETLQKKLDNAVNLQEQMKAANAIIRKHVNVENRVVSFKKGATREQYLAQMEAAGISQSAAEKLIEPDFAGRIGFPAHELTNNNATITRLKARIAELSAMKEAGDSTEKWSGGVTVEEDATAARIRIRFSGKPDEEARTALKEANFRWSPTEGAWQTNLNNRGRYNTDSVLTKLGYEKEVEAPTEAEAAEIPEEIPTAEEDGAEAAAYDMESKDEIKAIHYDDGKYWYMADIRPASESTTPEGVGRVIDSTRHGMQRFGSGRQSSGFGIVGYDNPLSGEDLKQYTLFPFVAGKDAIDMRQLFGGDPYKTTRPDDAEWERMARGVLPDAEDAPDTPGTVAESPDLSRPTRQPTARALPAIHREELNAAMVAPPTARVPVAPLPNVGESLTPPGELIKALSLAVGRNVRVARQKRGVAGSYSPDTARTTIRWYGDLETTAHEVGHALDDAYSLGAPWHQPRMRSPYDAELFQPAFQATTRKSHNLRTQRLEAIAEWFRAYAFNPDEARRLAPTWTTYVESALPSETLRVWREFGDGARSIAGAPATRQAELAIAFEEGDARTVREKLTEQIKGDGYDFSLTGLDKLKTAVLDSMRPVEAATEFARKITGAANVLPERDPLLLMRLHAGEVEKVNGFIESGLRTVRGEAIPDAGSSDPNAKLGGLNWLLEPLMGTSVAETEQNMRLAAVLGLAERTLEKSVQFKRDAHITGIGMGLFSDATTARAVMAELQQAPPEVLGKLQEGLRRYRAWANALLDYSVEAGRMSQEDADAIKSENQQYIALQRMLEDQPVFVGTGNARRLGSVSNTVQKMKGSDRRILNPFVSLLDQTYKTISEADRNAAVDAFFEPFRTGRTMHSGSAIALERVASRVQAKSGPLSDERKIRVFHNGVEEVWDVHPDVYAALKGLGEPGSPKGLLHVVSTLTARLPRTLITNNPAFATRNFLRDSIERSLKSSVGSTPVDSFKLFSAEDRQAYYRAGGGNAGNYLASRKSYAKALKQAVNELSGNSIVLIPQKGASVYNRLVKLSEEQGRMAEFTRAFKEGKKRGYDDYNASLFAAAQARGLMDFAVAGTLLRSVQPYIPFVNAAIQGNAATWRAAGRNPGVFLYKFAMLAVASLIPLLIAKAGGDEELEEYRNLPAYQRDLFFNIKLGPDLWLRFPKGFEAAVLASGVERSIDRAMGNERAFAGYLEAPGAQSENMGLRALSGTLVQNLLPIRFDDLLNIGGVPGALAEIRANHDTFRQRAIVPQYEARLPIAERKGTERASRVGKLLSNVLASDPRAIDHFITSIGGGTAQALLSASDIGREDKALTPARKANMVFGTFSGSPSFGSPVVEDAMARIDQAGFRPSGSPRRPNPADLMQLAGDGLREAKTPVERDTAARGLRKSAIDILADSEPFERRRIQKELEAVVAKNYLERPGATPLTPAQEKVVRDRIAARVSGVVNPRSGPRPPIDALTKMLAEMEKK